MRRGRLKDEPQTPAYTVRPSLKSHLLSELFFSLHPFTFLQFIYLFIVVWWDCATVGHSVLWEVMGHLKGIGSSLLPYRVWGMN